VTEGATRIRIHFTKQGDLRWISHRDLARVWERLLRRANLELAFSQGFHPKPKVSFPSALTLGIEALDEVVELELMGIFDLTDVGQRIAQQMPDGMKLLSIDKHAGKTRWLGASYQIELPNQLIEPTQSRITELMDAGMIHVLRENKPIECSCKDAYFAIRLEGNKLLFSLPVAEQGASIRPSELLQQLYLEQLLTEGTVLQRTQVHLDQRTPEHSLSRCQTTED
jgi:radical SAM-linked protein